MPAAYPGPPEPPRGPGVRPPFPAPPSEGRTARLWLGLGVAALAVLLCCGGGSVALVGFAISGSEAISEQAQVVVGDYFEAVREGQYGEAYSLLCDEAREQETRAEFERRISAEPEIDSYQVGEATFGIELVVPVDVSYAGGGRDSLRAELAQDSQDASLKVCRVS
ncbi:hypothetical protein O7627_25675 [Solwaraspora sp. WMMD1047]|uniref:hypothetical protein n=1 Tax=Solwaraspora sp. WMMD1047 TaxID=3016102 RepID=UPI002416222E|nr:hypothetical protein [Solwaraspora sp. WMMD1047]MDG4832673.1 hypothetical protein [Solwaraspora sp. WMMD1047]